MLASVMCVAAIGIAAIAAKPAEAFPRQVKADATSIRGR
jgi:hypothetical protein